MNEASKHQPIRDYKDLHVWQKDMAYLPVVQSVPRGGKRVSRQLKDFLRANRQLH